MLSQLSQLLADDSNSPIGFILGAVVVVIWIVGGVLAQLKKKADRERWNNPQPQQNWDHLLRDLTAGQSRPYTPNTPAPPLPNTQQRPPQIPVQIRQRPQQVKSFAQQSPRPFVQQYRPPQVQQRPPMTPRRVIQAPRPIQPKPKPQRRPSAIPQQAVRVPTPPQAQVGLIQDATVTMGQVGGATAVQSSTARSGSPRVTRAQLRKLILWSEVLAPPLSIRQ